MTEMRSRFAGHHVHHFPCDCADWHHLVVEVDDVDKDWQYLDIADTYWPHSWRDRLRAAGKVLRGKPHYARAVVLDEANVRDLKAVIDSLFAPREPEGGERGEAARGK